MSIVGFQLIKRCFWPPFSFGLFVAPCFLLTSQIGVSQAGLFGIAPDDTLGVRDIATEYHLPPLHIQVSEPLYQSIVGTQVLSRAKHLGLTPRSAVDAWKEAASTYQQGSSEAEKPFPANPILFTGSRASELNRLMASLRRCNIRVTSSALLLDQSIYPKSRCSLDLGKTQLKSMGFQPYQIQIKSQTGVRVMGGRFTGGRWGISVAHSRDVVITGISMNGLSGGGIMVSNSYRVAVMHNRFCKLGGAGVMLHGDTQHAVIAQNAMLDDIGWSNWHAGIVITDRNADPADDATTLLREDGILVKQAKIIDRLMIPHDNVIVRNQVAGNKTSGIYSDGGARNTFVQNIIEDNSKEGMCLDNGSTANVVAFNLIRANGKRWGMNDAELKRDFVANYGRLSDGTSPAKLPGISMDNAAYNQVIFNQLDRNFGSGVKMVRTSFYNLIGGNSVTDNNEGANPKLHFFGILIGFAGADESAWDLNFVPSRGNEVFANSIIGSHFAGIFFEDGADQNIVFDNTIFGATKWAIDSFRPQPEESFNNLSNIPYRNIDSGLDPHLLELGKGRREH